MKKPTKEAVMHEVKEVLAIVLYLAVSLSILGTYKSLVLFQRGVDEFSHNYAVAAIEALALGKIVALTQNLPLMKAFSDRALVWAVLYQSIVMTIIVDLGGMVEDQLFPRTARLLEQTGDPMVLMVSHQFVSMGIFIVLYSVRGADKALGSGSLWKLFFQAPERKGELEKEKG